MTPTSTIDTETTEARKMRGLLTEAYNLNRQENSMPMDSTIQTNIRTVIDWLAWLESKVPEGAQTPELAELRAEIKRMFVLPTNDPIAIAHNEALELVISKLNSLTSDRKEGRSEEAAPE